MFYYFYFHKIAAPRKIFCLKRSDELCGVFFPENLRECRPRLTAGPLLRGKVAGRHRGGGAVRCRLTEVRWRKILEVKLKFSMFLHQAGQGKGRNLPLFSSPAGEPGGWGTEEVREE